MNIHKHKDVNIYLCIYIKLNETVNGNFKNTLIQWNMYNVQNFRPHLRSSSVARRQYIYIYGLHIGAFVCV